MRRALLLLLLAWVGLAWWWTRERGSSDQADLQEPSGGAEVRRTPRDGGIIGRATGATSIVEIKLYGAPVSAYLGALEPDDADVAFRERVARVSRGRGVYDLNLARAAREVAYQGALVGGSLPGGAVDFILRSNGAPDHSVARVILATNGGGFEGIDGAIKTAIDDKLGDRGELRIGIGEIATPGEAHARRLVVLAARREYVLEPLPRAVPLGGSWTVRGRTGSWRDLNATALLPDGELRKVGVVSEGESFAVQIEDLDTPGELHVSVDGVGPAGPGKLLQVTGEVGQPIPSAYQAAVFADEGFEDVASAEAYAMELINGDREALGLPPLEHDPDLSSIARAHSEEMAALGYFGHRSPRSGLVGDRLRAAAYRASAHGENLALNESVSAAHFSLMASIGHRSNLVSETFDRAGVGIARRSGEREDYYLTQVFARHAARIDPDSVAAQVMDKLNAVRAAGHLDALAVDEELREIAREAAQHSLSESDPESAMGVIRGRDLQRSVAISAAIVYDLGQLELPAATGDEVYSRVGIGIAQGDRPDEIAIAAVILLAR